MLAVDGEYLYSLFLCARGDYAAARYEHFFVGKRYVVSAFDRGEGGQKPAEP